MVNILRITGYFIIVTCFTTFYRRTKISKTHGPIGNSFAFTNGLVICAQTTRSESSRHSKPTSRTYFGI